MNKTLLIMAAGMGSRFGGLKQIEPIGPNGEFLIDYSIYDAINAGYNKVIFIIKKENFEIFKETIGKRVEDKIKVEYAFQDINNIPQGYTVPDNRIKPWGTAHAILSAKELIHEQFTIINADDFYGTNAYKTSYNFNAENDNNYAITGYLIKNVLSKNGAVKRGVCISDEQNNLQNLLESSVEEINNEIIAQPLDGTKSFKMQPNDEVSMNMLTFTPSIFKYIEQYFTEFLDKNIENLQSCEYLIPDLINKLVQLKKISVKIIPTDSMWYGVTYKEDKEEVEENIKKLIKEKKYPNNLWQK